MNLFLHGIEDFDVVRGDTLANPAFHNNDKLRTFDVVLANPPYSIKSWDRIAWQSDKWGRNHFGTPPQGCADFAFWQHILSSMDRRTGRCAILFPHGVLFRDSERDMRMEMIRADVIEAVIGMGSNLFYNSSMEACVVICRTHKHKDRKGNVLFINAVDEVSRQQAQSFLSDEHISRIANSYKAFEPEDGFSAIATIEEILAKNGNLSIVTYVRPPKTKEDSVDVSAALQKWRITSAEVRNAADGLFKILNTERNKK
jgi:type I restriction enzyme M protein